MSVDPLQSLEQSLRRGEVAPLYLFYGEEGFLVDQAVTRLVGEALDETARSFNLDRVYGREADAQDVLSLINSYPMIGKRRVVVVHDADKLANLERLLPAVEHPHTVNCLVMTAVKPDFRLKFFQALREKGVGMEFRRLSDYEIPDWIGSRIRALGKDPAPEACQLIQSYVGRSLREINNEIEKVVLYVGDRRVIGADDVNGVVGMSRQYNIFELQRAVGLRDIPRSMEILEGMLKSGESPVGMIVMLTRYFLKLWLIEELLAGKVSQSQLPGRAGLSPFFLKDYLAAVRGLPPDHLRHCFAALVEADEGLKSSTMDQRILMTILVYRLTARISRGNSGNLEEHLTDSGSLMDS